MAYIPDPADDIAIRNFIAECAFATDYGSLDEAIDAFMPDAEWALPGQPPIVGRDAIRADFEARRATGGVGPGSGTKHFITTQQVAMQSRINATSRTYLITVGVADGRPVIRGSVQYYDTLVRTGTGWKLQRREVVP